MKRICSNGMCKEYKNGNITIKFDRETVEDAREPDETDREIMEREGL